MTVNIRIVRRCALAFFVVYLLAVIWPLATLVSAAEPMILGLPLSMAWAIVWILLGFVALLILDRFECRHESRHEGRDADTTGHEGRDAGDKDREGRH